MSNIAIHLKQAAARHPYKRAVVYPAGRDRAGRMAYVHLTFLQLDRESDALAHGMEGAGMRPGSRTILMVKPCLEFFTLIFALFKVGAVPVVVDPGMGIRRMIACYRESRPEAFIGIPKAHVLRAIFPKFFETVKIWITVGKRWFWGGLKLDQLRPNLREPYRPASIRRHDMAAILFTTGSTGPAKGAVYTHANFDAQLQQIKTHLKMDADELDLSTFPLFALFYPALGVTAVIPDMDPTRPARANPERIMEAITDQGITNMFASPALLHRLGAHGRQHHTKLPSLKRVISAGAPVSAATIEKFSAMLPEGADIHTPYGATEAVPIVSITGREILSETRHLTERGYGICVGRPINDTLIRIIKISDTPIGKWSNDLVVPPGDVGEITVKADLVSRHYFENQLADSLAKIAEGKQFWHRMGDLGWTDSNGRIWYCGRKSHRVVTGAETLFTIPCEAIFNNHPAVFRSALVGIGERASQKPVICIELNHSDRKVDRNEIRQQLLELAAGHQLTRNIRTVLFHRSFPVDIRHNSKIFREKLALWAARKLASPLRKIWDR